MSESGTAELPQIPFSKRAKDFGRALLGRTSASSEVHDFGRESVLPTTAADKAGTISRRNLVKRGLQLGAGAALAAGGIDYFAKEKDKTLQQSDSTKQGEIPVAPHDVPKISATATPDTQETVEVSKQPDYLTELNNILAVPPFQEDGITPNQDRTDMEKAYVNKLLEKPQEEITLAEIDKSISAIVDADKEKSLRTSLMNLRFEMRQQHFFEKDGVMPLVEDKLQWAKDNDISPEILAICLDNEKRTEGIIKQLLVAGKLRDELKDLTPQELDAIDPEEFMINPGGLAELFMQETGGFINIGGAQALSQLDGEYYSERTTALPQLCEFINNEPKIGLHYVTENIAGSGKGGPENESGGAIGPQFMPGHALETLQLIHDVTGQWLNPFDPSDAAAMSWVFLAQQQWVGPGPDGYRVGYKKGDDLAILDALKKWNNLPSEYNAIYKDAVDYYYQFLAAADATTTSTEKPRRIVRIAQSDKRYDDLLKRAA